MRKLPIQVNKVAAQKGQTFYPEPFATLVRGRTKRKLGNIFELTNFGINLTELDPGSVSSVMHFHTKQDEFLYILEGTPILVLGDEEHQMEPNQCVGFKAGTEVGHQLVNRSKDQVVYLEIGDRASNDGGAYTKDDLHAHLSENGEFVFTHKDGTPY